MQPYSHNDTIGNVIRTLKTIVAAYQLQAEDYALTGSAAVFLHAVSSGKDKFRAPKDIDIYLFSDSYTRYAVRPILDCITLDLSNNEIMAYNAESKTTQKDHYICEFYSKGFMFGAPVPVPDDIEYINIRGISIPVVSREYLYALKCFSAIGMNSKHLDDLDFIKKSFKLNNEKIYNYYLASKLSKLNLTPAIIRLQKPAIFFALVTNNLVNSVSRSTSIPKYLGYGELVTLIHHHTNIVFDFEIDAYYILRELRLDIHTRIGAVVWLSSLYILYKQSIVKAEVCSIIRSIIKNIPLYYPNEKRCLIILAKSILISRALDFEADIGSLMQLSVSLFYFNRAAKLYGFPGALSDFISNSTNFKQSKVE